jgi:hypothetical protein
VESQQGRRAAPHVYPCAERPQALLSRKAIGLWGKVGGGESRSTVRGGTMQARDGVDGSAAPGASGRGGSLRVRSETRGMDADGKRRTGSRRGPGAGWKAALAATLLPVPAGFPRLMGKPARWLTSQLHQGASP